MKYSIIGLFPGPQAGDAKAGVKWRILSEAKRMGVLFIAAFVYLCSELFPAPSGIFNL